MIAYVAGIGRFKTNETTESFRFSTLLLFQLGKGAYFRGAPVGLLTLIKKPTTCL